MPTIQNGVKVASAYEEFLMSRCFSGKVARDCAHCKASMGNGGTCCFGDEERFEANSDACDNCTHFADCESVVWENSMPTPTRTFSKFSGGSQDTVVQIGGLRDNTTRHVPTVYRPPQPQPSRPTLPQVAAQRRVPTPNRQVVQYEGPRTVTAQLIESAEEIPTGDSRGGRFLKDVAQGGVEGLLEAALAFVRRWRW